MPKKKQNLLQGDQLSLVVDEVKQDQRGVIIVLIDDCGQAELDRLLKFATEKFGDRLVSHSVMVDIHLLDADRADVDVFRTNAAPVTMVCDWELSSGESHE